MKVLWCQIYYKKLLPGERRDNSLESYS